MNSKIYFFLALYSLLITDLRAQTLRDYIDGAKVAVDVLKISKENKAAKDSATATQTAETTKEEECTVNYGEICFENNLLATVEIVIYLKDNISDTVNLIIPKAANDCTYQVPVNIYEYQILHAKSKAIIRKGQLKVEKCDSLEVKIQ